MKKVFTIVLSLILVFALTACGGGGTDSGDGDSSSSGDVLVLKTAHVDSEEGPLHQSYVKFKEYVEAESDGTIQVDIYPNGELGGDRQVVEAINLGTIHMSAVAAGTLTNYDEKFSILSLPFLFDTPEEMEANINGEFGDLMKEWMEDYGFKCFGFQYDGARCVSNNKVPINTVDDMKGLKIRVMESPIFIKMFQLLGANPTPMSFSEVYTGLQQGVVDGQDNPPGLTYTSKFSEVLKYYSLTQHVYSNCPILWNKEFLESLPQEQYDIIEQGSLEFLHDWNRAENIRMESEYIELIGEGGTEVNELSPENKAAFKAAMQPVYDEYREIIGEDMDKALDLIK